ncbi:MAG: RidA family protein [bacterium]|nr:RidA family protein [bacterium]
MNLDIELPKMRPVPGNFIQAVVANGFIFLAGKGPLSSDKGKVGKDITKDRARELSREIGLRLLSVIKHEIGSLHKIDRCVKVNGYVNCIDTFDSPTEVIDGCSELFIEVFGEQGRHARTAVGVSTIYHDCPVEIEAVFLLKL